MNTFYATDSDTPAARCMSLIERNAPKFMSECDWVLSRRMMRTNTARMSPQQLAQAEAMLRETGGHDQQRIADAIGFSQSAISLLWKRMKREGRDK